MTTPFQQTTRRATISLNIAGQLDTLELGDDLHAFKKTTMTQGATHYGASEFTLRIEGQPRTSATITSQGVVDGANLKKLLEGEDFRTTPHSLCSARLMEHFRLNGFREDPKHGYDVFKERVMEPYDVLLADTSAIERLVRVESSSHMLFDRNGLALPTPVFYGHNDGRMTSKTYDLEAVAQLLLSRPDVQIFPRSQDWRQEPDYAGTATTVKEAIVDGPSYDEEDESYQAIHFAYRPSVEDYRKIWDQCLSYRGQHPSTERHRAVFDLDMLGLRAAGAALTDGYYGDARKKA